jgi:hypothetical protein
MSFRSLFLFIISFSLIHSSASAQLFIKNSNKNDRWIHGKVLLKSGERFEGKISFDNLSAHGLIKMKSNDSIALGNVYNTLEFSFNDSAKMRKRTFYSINLNGKQSFAEMLLQGKWILLFGKTEITVAKSANTAITHTTLKDGTYVPYPTKYNSHKTYKYFLVDLNSLTTQEINKDNILSSLPDKAAELEDFISNQNLKFRKTEDYITLLNEYEELKSTD